MQNESDMEEEQKASDLHKKSSGQQEDLTELFSEKEHPDTFGRPVRSLTNGAEKIWKMQYRTLASTGRFVMSYVEQTDAGQGYRVLTDNVMPIATFLGRMGKKQLASFAAL